MSDRPPPIPAFPAPSESSGREARRVDYEAIKRVAAVAELVEVKALSFAAGPLSDDSMPPAGADFDEEIKVKSRHTHLKDGKMLFVMVAFEFKYLPQEPATAIGVDGEIGVAYRLSESMQGAVLETDRDFFAEVNGVFNAWPFIRELVASCAARIGEPGVTLPLWRSPAVLPPAGEDIVVRRKRGPGV